VACARAALVRRDRHGEMTSRERVGCFMR
jgi:hypothetical protein